MIRASKLFRRAASAIAVTLILAGCAPAAVGSLFAPCPVPNQAEWEASQEEWLRSGRPDAEQGHAGGLPAPGQPLR